MNAFTPSDELRGFSLTDDDGAKALAQPFRMNDEGEHENDPFDQTIKPSLLSADHIAEYVKKTGMICPYEPLRNEKSSLKAASYEGRIGNSAYAFDQGSNELKQIFKKGDQFLVLPPNSIVFVESDIYFRLPPFIAVRFNLQIRLVH